MGEGKWLMRHRGGGKLGTARVRRAQGVEDGQQQQQRRWRCRATVRSGRNRKNGPNESRPACRRRWPKGVGWVGLSRGLTSCLARSFLVLPSRRGESTACASDSNPTSKLFNVYSGALVRLLFSSLQESNLVTRLTQRTRSSGQFPQPPRH